MMNFEMKSGVIVACLLLGACKEKSQAIPTEAAAEKCTNAAKLIEPGNLFEMDEKPAPTTVPAATINIVITDPNPASATASITSSNGKNIRPTDDAKLDSAFDMDLLKLGDNKKDYVIVNIKLVSANTKFHDKWPLTTNCDGKGLLNIIALSPDYTEASFWINRNGLKTDIVSYNLHYKTKYKDKDGKDITNDWAFDPKVRNEG